MLQNVYQEQNVSCFSGLCSGGTAAIGQKRCQAVFADIFLRPGAAKHNSCSQAWIWNMNQNLHKKNGGLHQLPFYRWWFLSSTLKCWEPSNWRLVRLPMAWLLGLLPWLLWTDGWWCLGRGWDPFLRPIERFRQAPRSLGRIGISTKNEGWIFTLFFLQTRSDKDGVFPFFVDKRSIRVGYWKGYYKIRNFHEKMGDSMRRWWSRCSHATNKFGTTGWLFEEIRNAGWGRGYELFSWFFIWFLYFFHTFLFLRCKAWW